MNPLPSCHLPVILLAAGIFCASPLQASLVFTFENAGVQATTVANVTTEDFEGASPNKIGTFSGGGSVAAASQYGGAGGVGKFLSIGNGSPATLTLNTDQYYLGLWWSAGDPGNLLSFYDASNNLLGSYVSSTLDGLPSSYLGNPTINFLGQNSSEFYAYLNFTVTGATNPIHKVVFGGTNFELDNISVTTDRITPPGNSTVPDGGSSLLMMSSSLAAAFGLQLALKKRR